MTRTHTATRATATAVALGGPLRGRSARLATAALTLFFVALAAPTARATDPAPGPCSPNPGALAPLAGSNFEGADGNMCDPDSVFGVALDDWQTVPNASITDPAGNKQDTIFGPGDAGSSNEQIPDTWELTRGNEPLAAVNVKASWPRPDPNPLLCAMPTCDLFLYLALIRETAGGSTNLSFELNQKQPGYRSSPASA